MLKDGDVSILVFCLFAVFFTSVQPSSSISQRCYRDVVQTGLILSTLMNVSQMLVCGFMNRDVVYQSQRNGSKRKTVTKLTTIILQKRNHSWIQDFQIVSGVCSHKSTVSFHKTLPANWKKRKFVLLMMVLWQ